MISQTELISKSYHSCSWSNLNFLDVMGPFNSYAYFTLINTRTNSGNKCCKYFIKSPLFEKKLLLCNDSNLPSLAL